MINKTNFTIQQAVEEDYKRLNFVNKETWLHTYPNEENDITVEDIENLDWQKFENNWKTKLATSEVGLYCLTAKIENKIVGFIVVKEFVDFVSFGSIYILPDYQRLGIGSALINQALNFVSKNKIIVVKVAEYNHNSINFYKKMGFIFSEKAADFKLSETKSIPQIKLTKFNNKFNL
jgi:ribosomal protein S18 acetylase RimI-like enzyme